jgi:hypothetical protein
MSKLLGSSRRIRARRPLGLPVGRTVTRADAVTLAFDYAPEKQPAIPAGACSHYGEELPAGWVCPATCPDFIVHACYETYERANR